MFHDNRVGVGRIGYRYLAVVKFFAIEIVSVQATLFAVAAECAVLNLGWRDDGLIIHRDLLLDTWHFLYVDSRRFTKRAHKRYDARSEYTWPVTCTFLHVEHETGRTGKPMQTGLSVLDRLAYIELSAVELISVNTIFLADAFEVVKYAILLVLHLIYRC